MSKAPRLNTIYHTMEFPPYEYREFPMWVKHPETGADVLVHDERERDVVLAAKPLIREEDEKVRLIKVAELAGVQVDKRWGNDRLAKAIADAGYDPDHNPFE
jgi:hypothetical protein